jgi:DNA-binding response OmpR family regulator
MERVLVVDDDAHISALLERNLVQQGMMVRTCNSAVSALEAAKSHRPDLVILDVMLGDGTGYEVARRIRRDPELYRSCILFQSVAGDELDISHALRQGGDAYLKKPYSLTGLTEQLAKLDRQQRELAHTCPLTGLPGRLALHREVDHRLFRGQEFALCILFMKGLRVFRKEIGPRAEQRIAELTAKSIRTAVRNYGIYETFTAHIGGGYFMAVVGMDDCKRFREHVKDEFRKQEAALHEVGICDPPSKAKSKASAERRTLLKLLVGATHTQRDRFVYADEMFEKLRRAEELTHQEDARLEQRLKKGRGHDHWV